MVRRWRSLLAAVGLVAASCASCTAGGQAGEAPVGPAPPAAASPAAKSTLAWQPCGPGLECATLEVPLDYRHRLDRQVPIALVRRPATGPNRVGSLLLNPGGPGDSGIDGMSMFETVLSPQVQRQFDLVTFDPRGVGRSEGIHCVDGPTMDRLLALDPAPTTTAGVQALFTHDGALAQACVSSAADLLPFIGTVNAAQDMDRIRAALGEDRLRYFGFSYGSLLGTVYAGLYPNRVGSMVLDGAIDPALDPVADDEVQSVGLEHGLDAFVADCSATPSCAWQPGVDRHQAFRALMAALRAHPLAVGGRQVGPGEAFLAVVAALYTRQSWPALAVALQRAARGDGSVLLASFDDYVHRRADGTYANTIEAFSAITCADQRWPTEPAAFVALAAEAARLAPDFGAANIWSNAVCAVWPVHATLPVGPVTAAGSPPIVVVGSTGDPVTPYAWARSLAAELQHGVLVTRRGEGHTGYAFSACVRGAVDAYLVDGTVPAVGIVCP